MPSFGEDDIDLDVLSELTDHDLKALGVSSRRLIGSPPKEASRDPERHAFRSPSIF
jgi:hypothetical protein